MAVRGRGAPSKFGDPSSMTATEMRSITESIGLTRPKVAHLMGVNVSTATRWWSGQMIIPEGVADEVLNWVRASEDLERVIKDQLHTTGTAETYLSVEDLEASGLPKETIEFGVLFHRVAAARALLAFNEDTDGPPGRLQCSDAQEA